MARIGVGLEASPINHLIYELLYELMLDVKMLRHCVQRCEGVGGKRVSEFLLVPLRALLREFGRAGQLRRRRH